VKEGRDGEEIQLVRSILGVHRVQFDEKYLGLPTPLGRVKKGMFQPLEARFFKRMTARRDKDLSAAGKEIRAQN
jgi:hypothetical protein